MKGQRGMFFLFLEKYANEVVAPNAIEKMATAMIKKKKPSPTVASTNCVSQLEESSPFWHSNLREPGFQTETFSDLISHWKNEKMSYCAHMTDWP